MAKLQASLSTGLPALDRVFRGVMPGDNIVWQVDSIEDYLPFVEPYARYARENKQKLVYFRFANHPPLLEADENVTIHELRPENGFEPFLADVHRIIDETGRGGLYIFDCLSELAPDWCSDRMLGNFFMLTCPYLYDRAAIAYFAILRDRHSFHATRPITTTAQVLVDAYQHEDKIYIHPFKVQHRHSPTMYMLHAWEGDDFVPVTQSCTITDILKGVPWSRLDSATYMRGYWSRTFSEAQELQDKIDSGDMDTATATETFSKILRMLISKDEPVLRLAEKYFCLRDLMDIRQRMIGTGLIGGKSVGMLLSRAILRDAGPRWDDLIEHHDSFFIGADVFYTYLVQNHCWEMMQKHKASYKPDDETETVRRRILAGEFPEYIVKQFSDMLDYFGQSPIIVRSSSLMEDNFGNAFAGKYESVFCANQGGPHKRLEDFLFAVRTVYASTMSEEALAYRAQKGLLGNDEQMALLIQRVSGATYGNLFYPQCAGVCFSYNPYVWHDSIDPEAGMMRLVFGLGTRAVDRADDDYTRIVAMNAPHRRPEGNLDEVSRYSQHRVDVLDLECNQLAAATFEDILKSRSPELPLDMFASRNREMERRAAKQGSSAAFAYLLTFDKLLKDTRFVNDMSDILSTLKEAYEHHIDIEFTANFFDGENYKINLVQCRPLETTGSRVITELPADIKKEDILLDSHGSVIGQSAILNLDWIIYVTPSVYGELPINDRYTVAHIIGALAHNDDIEGSRIMLCGPGRWGTTTPSLGVPSSFAEISPASVLCEIVAMRDDLVPDVSLGTHFFNELVENNMLYLAVFPNREDTIVNKSFFEEESENLLGQYYSEDNEAAKAIRLIRTSGESSLCLHAHMLKQRAVMYHCGT